LLRLVALVQRLQRPGETTEVNRSGRIGRGGVLLVVGQTSVGAPPSWETLPQLSRVLAVRLLTVLAERMVTAAGRGGLVRPAGRDGGDQDGRLGELAAGAVERQDPVVAP
jgi:hypothetical protein